MENCSNVIFLIPTETRNQHDLIHLRYRLSNTLLKEHPVTCLKGGGQTVDMAHRDFAKASDNV